MIYTAFALVAIIVILLVPPRAWPVVSHSQGWLLGAAVICGVLLGLTCR